MPRNWENEFLWVMGAKGKSFISITKRIAWGATIYHLWRHRNSRIHENDYSSGETIQLKTLAFNLISMARK